MPRAAGRYAWAQTCSQRLADRILLEARFNRPFRSGHQGRFSHDGHAAEAQAQPRPSGRTRRPRRKRSRTQPPEQAQAQPSPLDRVSQAFDGFTTNVQALENARAEAANRGTTTEQLRQRLAQARARDEEQLAQAEARETEATETVGSMRTGAVGSTDALISALQDFRASL